MSIEFNILNSIQAIRSPVLDGFMTGVSALGDFGLVWILLSLILLLIPKTRQTGILMALALIIEALICNCMIKPFIARPRPYEFNPWVRLLVPKPSDFSFPSGHTGASFAAAGSLITMNHYRSSILAGVLAILIAFSRMYLYVHYPTDILAGAVLGFFSAWLVSKFCSFMSCH